MIRDARTAQGLTLAELGTRLNTTASAIHQLERSEDAGTIKLGSMKAALAALNRDLIISAIEPSRLPYLAPHRVAEQLSEFLRARESIGTVLRYLTHSVHELSLDLSAISSDDFDVAPLPIIDRRWDTLFRAVYANAFPGRHRRIWMKATRLADKWYPDDMPILQNRADTTTPTFLKRLNIYLDDVNLARA